MFENRLDSIYMEWLLSKVCSRETVCEYSMLFDTLYNTYVNLEHMKELDSNRYEDGRMLRFRFESHHGDRISGIFSQDDLRRFEDRPCSILEMIIGLAHRMEEQIMGNLRYGDRTGQWFWEMLTNLGVGYMTNSRFNNIEYRRCVSNFMNYAYDPDGKGCLFRSEHKSLAEMTDLDIWYQMHEHLKDIHIQ